VNETAKLETLLRAEGEVRLGRRDAQEVLQKLRARGAGGATADRLESRLAGAGEVVLEAAEAHALLEELRASGRRWVFGSGDAQRPPAEATQPSPIPMAEPEPEPEREPNPAPEPEPERATFLRRLWRR
jgi:hypothetical protein